MARVKRNDGDNSRDISTYTNLGEMHWREALEKAYSPGIDTVAVCPEMFQLKGVRRLIPRHKTRDKVMVIYDREYIFYRMYTLFGKKLEIVKDGKFDEERFGIIFNGLKQYSAEEFGRELQNKVLSRAKLLDEEFPGKGISHWIKVLKNDVEENVKNEKTTTPNNAIELHENEAFPSSVDAVNVATIEETVGSSDDEKADILVATNETLEDEATDVETVVTTDESEVNAQLADDLAIDTANHIAGNDDEVTDAGTAIVSKKRGRPKKEVEK